LQPTPARVRIALIDECEHSQEIGDALAEAGYDVRYVREGDDGDDDAHVVVRVTSARPPSGISELAPAVDDSRPPTARQLGDAQRMDAIARLAGGIAHDFNNLLAVISICTDEVLASLNPSGEARACLEDIRHAVERGSAVTRDLLAFSRRDIPAPQLVDFNQVVTASHRMIERMVGDGIRIETSLTPAQAFVRIDPSQWSSVFINLALNARSAMPRGGSFSFRTRVTTLDPKEHGRDKPLGTYVELEVTDTGCGMTEEVRDRIFEPFFTTKPPSSATGLGLSVVYGVVEQSGGWIDVMTELDRGTTFRLYIPIAADAPVTETRTRRVLPEPREPTVLVVEDEDAIRRIAVRALVRSGYRVFEAASSEEALANVARMGSVDLLVTDVVLPGMNGRRLAEMLAEQLPSLAVLYTSGYTADEVLRFGIARSELSFLPKPYSARALVDRASALLAERASRLSPA